MNNRNKRKIAMCFSEGLNCNSRNKFFEMLALNPRSLPASDELCNNLFSFQNSPSQAAKFAHRHRKLENKLSEKLDQSKISNQIPRSSFTPCMRHPLFKLTRTNLFTMVEQLIFSPTCVHRSQSRNYQI